MENSLPAIPAKRYFTIGEVSDLCGVKPYVLRYWEQEFTQLKPMKRRGNRRYYQHHEVLLIRRIRELLYEQGFTISGARNRLIEPASGAFTAASAAGLADEESNVAMNASGEAAEAVQSVLDRVDLSPSVASTTRPMAIGSAMSNAQMRSELLSIRTLLTP